MPAVPPPRRSAAVAPSWRVQSRAAPVTVAPRTAHQAAALRSGENRSKGTPRELPGRSKAQVPAAHGGRAAVPTALTVVTPNAAQQAAGRYTLLEGEYAEHQRCEFTISQFKTRGPLLYPNGHPLWKHSASEYWIYCSGDGTWSVGAKSEEGSEEGPAFPCSASVIRHPVPHGGRLPHEVSGWERSVGGAWTED
eukprot:gene56644-biopygen22732